MMVDQDQHIGSVSFPILSYSTFYPPIKPNLNFPDLWPFNHRWNEKVTMNTFERWPKPTHWHSQFFFVAGCIKFDLSTVTCNDPKMTFEQKFQNTLKEPPANDLFTQVSSKSIELCRRIFLNIFDQWPLDDFDPKFLNTLLSLLTWLIMKNVFVILNHFFMVD